VRLRSSPQRESPNDGLGGLFQQDFFYRPNTLLLTQPMMAFHVNDVSHLGGNLQLNNRNYAILSKSSIASAAKCGSLSLDSPRSTPETTNVLNGKSNASTVPTTPSSCLSQPGHVGVPRSCDVSASCTSTVHQHDGPCHHLPHSQQQLAF